MGEPRLRELVEIRTAQLNGSADTLLCHAHEAVRLGESSGRLAALSHWRDSPLFSGRERAALRLAEAIALLRDAPAISAARREAANRFDAGELAQLILACVAANACDRHQLAADYVAQPAQLRG